jgi:hypothetical protein
MPILHGPRFTPTYGGPLTKALHWVREHAVWGGPSPGGFLRTHVPPSRQEDRLNPHLGPDESESLQVAVHASNSRGGLSLLPSLVSGSRTGSPPLRVVAAEFWVSLAICNSPLPMHCIMPDSLASSISGRLPVLPVWATCYDPIPDPGIGNALLLP